MFSPTTTYDSNNPPFILPSSSSSYPSTNNNHLPFYIEPENDHNSSAFFHDPLAPPFMPAECAPMFDHYGVVGGVVPSSFLMGAQKPAKKDRHSKIHTSQGLRDRRVRLSSEVARKFFDLQDMLEFDKPSNTLEWLFTKSEGAIKELARSKHACSTHTHDFKCSCHDEEQAAMQHSAASEKSLIGSSDSSSKGRKLKWAQRGEETKKESRDKARARARERTCHKNNNVGLRVQDLEDMDMYQWTSQMPHSQPYPYLLGAEVVQAGDAFNVIEESISMINKMNQNNLAIPKEDEISFNHINDYQQYSSFPYSTSTATPNWDTHDSFRGIATMNHHLSTCFMNQW